jgi:hypothetical protein
MCDVLTDPSNSSTYSPAFDALLPTFPVLMLSCLMHASRGGVRQILAEVELVVSARALALRGYARSCVAASAPRRSDGRWGRDGQATLLARYTDNDAAYIDGGLFTATQ